MKIKFGFSMTKQKKRNKKVMFLINDNTKVGIVKPGTEKV